MLFPELQQLLEQGKVLVGDDLWISDFRHDDIMNKPIRNVAPTQVKVFSNEDLPANKKVYYASYHFRPVGKNGKLLATVIAPYDNTGFRGYTGSSVNIFLTKDEAVESFKVQCDEVKNQIFAAKEIWEKRFNDMLAEVDSRTIAL